METEKYFTDSLLKMYKVDKKGFDWIVTEYLLSPEKQVYTGIIAVTGERELALSIAYGHQQDALKQYAKSFGIDV